MIQMMKEMVEYRELLWSLTLKDIRIRYKQTFLGITWAIFTPLAMMLIFTFVFQRVAKVSTGDIPYPIFVYCGLLPWTFFSASLTTAVTCLVQNSNLVTKIYFPREVLPLAAIFSKLIDFIIAGVVFVGLMIFYEVSVNWTILFFPFILLIQIIFMIGVSFLLSMGNLFYRDVGYLFNVLILLWMFVTSVIYPINVENPLMQRVLNLNPMTPIIDSYRNVLIQGVVPDIFLLFQTTIISLFVFVVGWALFHKYQYLFAERI